MTIVVVKGLLGRAEQESVLREVPACRQLGDVSLVSKIPVSPPLETPESLLLGMSPSEGQMRQGPLTVAAFGFDPPPRSTHFHVSLLSLNSDRVTSPPTDLQPDEYKVILTQLERLKSKWLTPLAGDHYDHAMVWEKRGDMGIHSPDSVFGRNIHEVLPEGDGEPELRRFIDDSVNLLAEQEFNHRRIQEGMAPLNLLWPWGNGERYSVPNLALRYGYPIRVISGSLRLQGLSRLAGLRHLPRRAVGAGLKTPFGSLVSTIRQEPVSITVLDCFQDLRTREEWDDVMWLAQEFGSKFLQPLLDNARDKEETLTMIFDGSEGGLVASFSGKRQEGRWPLDERSLSEPKISKVTIDSAIHKVLS